MPGSPAANEPAVSPRTLNTRPGLVFYLILISAIALFGAEVWTVTLGFLWALSGILSLSQTGIALVAVLVLPAATLATWKLALMAFEGERDLLRQPPSET